MSHRRSMHDKRKMRHLYSETKTRYGCGVYFDERKRRFIKAQKASSGYTKWLKRKANKRVRRDDEIYRGGSYRKLYEYWWTLF